MKKNIVIFILLICLTFLVGYNLFTSNNSVNRYSNFIISDYISYLTSKLENGESTTVPISQYDEIIVIPPYTSKDMLTANTNLSTNKLYPLLKSDENYSLFIIKNKEIIYYEILNSKLKTKDGKVLYLNHEDNLMVSKKEGNRPYVLYK